MTYKNPKLTVDGILVEHNEILLIKRRKDPFKETWALPGGFVEYGEKTEQAITREVLEETGLNCTILGLFGVYSDPNRDPRGHTVTIVYDLKRNHGSVQGGDDASDATFFPLQELPDLAFDHETIIKDKMERMNL